MKQNCTKNLAGLVKTNRVSKYMLSIQTWNFPNIEDKEKKIKQVASEN